MPKFYHQWDRPEKYKEPGGGQKKVETAGYISPKQQVQNLLNSGTNLRDYRIQNYQAGHEVKDDEVQIDPTTNPGFDMADASRILRSIELKKQPTEPETEPTSEEKPVVDTGEPKDGNV